MSGLQDIGPLTEVVTFVRGQKTSEQVVHGITAEGFFYLMQKFPEVSLLMEKRAGEITPERLMSMAPPTIAFVIGCGVVDVDEKMSDIDWQVAVGEQARHARKFSVSEQLRLISAIFKMTFSEGVSPFVEQLAALVGDTAGSQGRTGEAPATPSQGTLSASLVVGKMSGPRGAQLRVN
jgi:hypothetical protein